MKQLVSSCGNCFLVGFKSKALFFSRRSNSVSHLETTPRREKNSKTETESKPQAPKGEKGFTEDLDDIQAVQLIQVTPQSGEFWCAVSRGNKSLAIYKLNENDDGKNVDPSIVYNTPKRCTRLCFASLPNTSEDKSTGTVCLIAGDLAGDAYAYSLTQKRFTLLLGHTASMLTGVLVVGKNILTADRDEKIRISRFPETYVTEGYLLGHSAYISSIDAVTTKKGFNLVASCGGDCTVRLWGLDTIQPLSVTAVGTSTSDESAPLIPTDITLHPEGELLVVIYDQSKRLDLYSINSGDAGEIELGDQAHTIECASQPLCAVFQNSESLLVVMKEPDYIASYKVNNKEIVVEIGATEKVRHAAASNRIDMPETILERDSYGNIKLMKLNETRGPSGEDAPWNRIERVDIARERQKRHKKRKVEKNIALKKEKEAQNV